ncbi:hypothetical protein BS47DRAFT_1365130 [Hydnum rufescens UP504]|uniref:Uncharacterized protein n=1 Tax=Hydnum rufescens UP504 TaxID=1448309 RepID=A0A9P6AQ94_9AGAM|nr:hypothetical protein BS47DRAFT_1365130 [Hydnum rufescens UP504]
MPLPAGWLAFLYNQFVEKFTAATSRNDLYLTTTISLHVDGLIALCSSLPEPLDQCKSLIKEAKGLCITTENPKSTKTPVSMQHFLKAMLDCAPMGTHDYVINSILTTQGDPKKLPLQANIWFNNIIIPMRALGKKTPSGITPKPDLPIQVEFTPRTAKYDQLVKFQIQLYQTGVTHLPLIGCLDANELHMTWGIIQQFGGIPPSDITGLIGVSFQIVHERMYGTPADGTMVTFLDHWDPGDMTHLLDPWFLRLHATVAGIIHMSGAAEYIAKYLQDLQETCVLVTDGGTPIMMLLNVHSLNKLIMV